MEALGEERGWSSCEWESMNKNQKEISSNTYKYFLRKECKNIQRRIVNGSKNRINTAARAPSRLIHRVLQNGSYTKCKCNHVL
jgi:hypothetical protein